MSAMHIIYHLARADFLERVRRYSFLVMLGLVVFLGYQVAAGNMTLRLDEYRGEFNSAWVGSMMALISSFFLGWFGFFLVKGSVARDRETGVGQIMATTPLTRPLYMLGKGLSNFAVLLAMNLVLIIAAIGIQFLAGENLRLDLPALVAPFIFIALPLMAVVAALAVLFESIAFLSGGFGNVVYFILFVTIFPFIDTLSKTNPALEPLGLGLLQQSMGIAAKAAFPEYSGGFVLGDPAPAAPGIDFDPASHVFLWPGVEWTSGIILTRLGFYGLALVLALFASLFFDRFDPSRSKPMRMKKTGNHSAPEPVSVPQPLPVVHLSALDAAANRFSFFHVLLAELKLLLKGQRWWWYLVAAGFVVACVVNDATLTREILLPLAWVWPILVWSALGNREIHNNVQQMTFSSASPLWRQLPAQWLAGFIVTLLVASGAILRFLLAGDLLGLLALFSGAIFIPSLALASGVWSGSSKPFEILYMALWYIGPMNRVEAVDFTGAHASGHPEFFLPLSLLLIVLAFVGRARQLQN